MKKCIRIGHVIRCSGIKCCLSKWRHRIKRQLWTTIILLADDIVAIIHLFEHNKYRISTFLLKPLAKEVCSVSFVSQYIKLSWYIVTCLSGYWRICLVCLVQFLPVSSHDYEAVINLRCNTRLLMYSQRHFAISRDRQKWHRPQESL